MVLSKYSLEVLPRASKVCIIISMYIYIFILYIIIISLYHYKFCQRLVEIKYADLSFVETMNKVSICRF